MLPAFDTKLDGSGSPGGRRIHTSWLKLLFCLVTTSCTCKLPQLPYAETDLKGLKWKCQAFPTQGMSIL